MNKVPRLEGFTGELHQAFKEEWTPNLTLFPHAEEGKLRNSSVRPASACRPGAPVGASKGPYLAGAVQLLGYAPEVPLAGQGVQLVLHVVHKLLQWHQLVGPVELPPGRQCGDDFLAQVSHRRADLGRAGWDRWICSCGDSGGGRMFMGTVVEMLFPFGWIFANWLKVSFNLLTQLSKLV